MPSSLSLPPRASRADFEALASDKYPPAVRLIVLASGVVASWAFFYAVLVVVGP